MGPINSEVANMGMIDYNNIMSKSLEDMMPPRPQDITPQIVKEEKPVSNEPSDTLKQLEYGRQIMGASQSLGGSISHFGQAMESLYLDTDVFGWRI